MVTILIPAFDTLPIELIYRIFDNLDVQAIIHSLHHVCKRLDTIMHTYFGNAVYKLNFDTVSKSDFIRVRRFIQPENVISLTLSDQLPTSGQILLFLSLFSIEQFTRLRYLILVRIEDQHLKLILEHAVTFPLISLSIREKDNSNRSNATDTLIARIIERPGLQNFTLNLMKNGNDQIKWPISSTIKHLTLYHCQLKHFSIIFRHFSSLQTLVTKHCNLVDFETLAFDPIPMLQLNSLIMEDTEIMMSEVQLFLSNTPSLTHLRLTGYTYDIEYQWEELIQTKLPLLMQFEFYFYTKIYEYYITINVETLIAPFRTLFWRENKKWFVTCDQIMHSNNSNGTPSHDFRLYSIPVRNHYFEYYPDAIRITASTSMEMNNDAAVMDHVHQVNLTTETMTETTMTNEIALSTCLFRKASDLNIRINSTWPFNFVQRLSPIINLSNLEKLTLINESAEDSYPKMAASFVNLLKQAHNVRSMAITATWLDKTCASNMEHFCSIFPHHIQHLKIDIGNMNDMKIILDRLEHLISVTFQFKVEKEHWQTNIIRWLSARRDLTYCKDPSSLHIWLGNKISQQMTNSCKRLKTN